MSVPFSAAEAARWMEGELLQGRADAPLRGASIDTRSLPPGALFLAIVGPRHDAHDFLETARQNGAGGLVVQRGRALPPAGGRELPVIAVENTTRALGGLAAGHRAGFRGPLVAITGSNGKTTTKEMCAAILSRAAPCLKNEGNLNNQFGLPLTLLQRAPGDRSIVVELGMNHRGEIAQLAAIAAPGIGLITNVGSAHIEHLGSQDAIALEKGDLVAALPRDGTAVLNADDPRVAAQSARTPARVVWFGRGARADVRPARVRCEDGRAFAFELETPGGSTPVRVPGLGETAVQNALAAAAAALAAGASLDDVAAGLAAYRPVGGRLCRIDLAGDIVLIDDTYNANPQSMESALRILARLGSQGRALAVLGDMGELGDTAARAHRDTGRLAASLGIDLLVAVGAHAGELAGGAIDAGLDAGCVHLTRDSREAGARVAELLRKGDRVLVKGSRSMKMERVVEHLAAAGGAGERSGERG